MTAKYPQDIQQVVQFHGHMCPGLAIGYRAAKSAQAHLDVGRTEDEELVAILESDGCGVDVVQALFSCALGKGDLIYRDYGKQVYTLICRRQGRAVRVAMKPGPFDRTPEQEILFQKVLGGELRTKKLGHSRFTKQSAWTRFCKRMKMGRFSRLKMCRRKCRARPKSSGPQPASSAESRQWSLAPGFEMRKSHVFHVLMPTAEGGDGSDNVFGELTENRTPRFQWFGTCRKGELLT